MTQKFLIFGIKNHPDDDDGKQIKVRRRGNCVMTLYEHVSDRQTGRARLLGIKAQWNGTKKMALITTIKTMSSP